MFRVRFFGECLPAHDARSKSVVSRSNADPPPTIPSPASSGCNSLHCNNHIVIHVDATFKLHHCTYGIIFFNAKSAFVEAFSGPSTASSRLEAELYALQMALHIINQRCFTKVHIMSDSLLAVQLLHSDASLWPWRYYNAFSIVLTYGTRPELLRSPTSPGTRTSVRIYWPRIMFMALRSSLGITSFLPRWSGNFRLIWSSVLLLVVMIYVFTAM